MSTLRHPIVRHADRAETALRTGGHTLVELLVVVLAVTVVSLGLAKAIATALAVEQNYREEAELRTKLSAHAARLERYLSLAQEVSLVAVGGALENRATYRLETGGVSFETGTVIRVSSWTGTTTNGDLLATRVSADPRNAGTNVSRANLLSERIPGVASLTDIVLEGNQAVRRLRLTATYPYRTWSNGLSIIRTNSLSVERPVRLWNRT